MRWFRLLPLTAVVAAVFLLVKLNAIWTGVATAWEQGIVVAEARAANSPPSSAAHASVSSQTEAATASAGAGTRPQSAQGTGKTSGTASTQASYPMSEGFTASEIGVLQKLVSRREELASRAEDIERRESLLKAAELRIDEKLKNMKDLQAKLEALIQAREQQEDAQILSLVKIYENMKPKDAARIFEELDMNTLIEVAQRMKERKLAPILAKVEPTRAKQITETLAQLQEFTDQQNGENSKNKS